MKTVGVKIWQQGAGDNQRNYADLCLRWGVILSGPGNQGPWPQCEGALQSEGISAKKRTDLRRFCEEMQDGDIVALRVGTSKCVAVGRIVGDYLWNDSFGDIDGWDIQHVRRVNWVWQSLDDPIEFGNWAFKYGDTTQILDKELIISWIEEIPEATREELPTLPEDPGNLEIEAVAEHLFDQGVASEVINRLVFEISELERIASWYARSDLRPSETETIANLAVPFLRTLGWTPQLMAMEWNNVDIALFSTLPRTSENLETVVEAKKMDNSCLSAKQQAADYAQTHGCNELIVTDGIRYGHFVRDVNGGFELASYLNLTRPRATYPVLGCDGAKQAIHAMIPHTKPVS